MTDSFGGGSAAFHVTISREVCVQISTSAVKHVRGEEGRRTFAPIGARSGSMRITPSLSLHHRSSSHHFSAAVSAKASGITAPRGLFPSLIELHPRLLLGDSLSLDSYTLKWHRWKWHPSTRIAGLLSVHRPSASLHGIHHVSFLSHRSFCSNRLTSRALHTLFGRAKEASCTIVSHSQPYAKCVPGIDLIQWIS